MVWVGAPRTLAARVCNDVLEAIEVLAPPRLNKALSLRLRLRVFTGAMLAKATVPPLGSKKALIRGTGAAIEGRSLTLRL